MPRIPATVKPTGASAGAWHGSEAAQPSRALISPGLRSSFRLSATYAESDAPAAC